MFCEIVGLTALPHGSHWCSSLLGSTVQYHSSPAEAELHFRNLGVTDSPDVGRMWARNGGVEGICAAIASAPKVPVNGGPCSETRGRGVTWSREAFVRDNQRRYCFSNLIWPRLGLLIMHCICLTPLHALRPEDRMPLLASAVSKESARRRIDFGRLICAS